MKEAWAHPNVHDISQTLAALKDMVWCCPSSVSGLEVSLSRHIIHVIGHEDNHIQRCLNVAADSGEFEILMELFVCIVYCSNIFIMEYFSLGTIFSGYAYFSRGWISIVWVSLQPYSG
jgi:hypothetical protein